MLRCSAFFGSPRVLVSPAWAKHLVTKVVQKILEELRDSQAWREAVGETLMLSLSSIHAMDEQ